MEQEREIRHYPIFDTCLRPTPGNPEQLIIICRICLQASMLQGLPIAYVRINEGSVVAVISKANLFPTPECED